MILEFLGTGTSHGIPVIGCTCPICRSDDPKNRRTRSSAWVKDKDHSILIDAGPDFRTQALRSGMDRLDAILLTHSHADHLFGFDDIRPLCRKKPIEVYASRYTADELRKKFDYVFRPDSVPGGGIPRIILHVLDENDVVQIGNFKIRPIPLNHGPFEVYGYRINDTAYLTDCSYIADSSFDKLKMIDTLIIDALRERPHPTHFSISQALDAVKRIEPKRAFLTHLCHDVDHLTLSNRLPKGVEPAYDGLSITIT